MAGFHLDVGGGGGEKKLLCQVIRCPYEIRSLYLLTATLETLEAEQEKFATPTVKKTDVRGQR